MTFLAANFASSNLMMMTGLMASSTDQFLRASLGLAESSEAITSDAEEVFETGYGVMPLPVEKRPIPSHFGGAMTQEILRLMRWRYGQIAKDLHHQAGVYAAMHPAVAHLHEPPATPYDAMRAKLDSLLPREQQPQDIQAATIPSELYSLMAEHSLKILLGELTAQWNPYENAKEDIDAAIEKINQFSSSHNDLVENQAAVTFPFDAIRDVIRDIDYLGPGGQLFLIEYAFQAIEQIHDAKLRLLTSESLVVLRDLLRAESQSR